MFTADTNIKSRDEVLLKKMLPRCLSKSIPGSSPDKQDLLCSPLESFRSSQPRKLGRWPLDPNSSDFITQAWLVWPSSAGRGPAWHCATPHHSRTSVTLVCLHPGSHHWKKPCSAGTSVGRGEYLVSFYMVQSTISWVVTCCLRTRIQFVHEDMPITLLLFFWAQQLDV